MERLGRRRVADGALASRSRTAPNTAPAAISIVPLGMHACAAATNALHALPAGRAIGEARAGSRHASADIGIVERAHAHPPGAATYPIAETSRRAVVSARAVRAISFRAYLATSPAVVHVVHEVDVVASRTAARAGRCIGHFAHLALI